MYSYVNAGFRRYLLAVSKNILSWGDRWDGDETEVQMFAALVGVCALCVPF